MDNYLSHINISSYCVGVRNSLCMCLFIYFAIIIFLTIKLISLEMSVHLPYISTDLLHICLPPVDCFNLYMYILCNGKITKKDPSTLLVQHQELILFIFNTLVYFQLCCPVDRRSKHRAFFFLDWYFIKFGAGWHRMSCSTR